VNATRPIDFYKRQKEQARQQKQRDKNEKKNATEAGSTGRRCG